MHVWVWSDYVCPWCYMFHSSLERVRRHRDLMVSWKAFELSPREHAPAPEEVAAKERMIQRTWPDVQRMAEEVYGLRLDRPKLGVDTRLAHVAAKAAAELGHGEAYHQALFAAHWQEGRDISDPGVLRALAEELGLDGEAFAQALERQDLLDEVMAEEAQAHQLGLTGVPAAVIARRYLVSGARPPEQLEDIFRRIEQELGNADA
ncbi:MAG: hypothetical protein BAA04_08745 [Firmicutes bacterium ZCTH02-B6]|nr:MAG: hypothetical protein BAA04_08745 [Firmicutes bacterium ZCTH02-B6]